MRNTKNKTHEEQSKLIEECKQEGLEDFELLLTWEGKIEIIKETQPEEGFDCGTIWCTDLDDAKNYRDMMQKAVDTYVLMNKIKFEIFCKNLDKEKENK